MARVRSNEELKRIVLDDVTRRVPIDPTEAVHRERFLADVPALDAPFSRDADHRHVTGSGFVVGPRGVVLLLHKKLGRWLQPGGHVDPGETPWEAARREIAEETGLRVGFAGGAPRLVHVSVHGDMPDGHVHYDLRYLFDGGDADPAPPAAESQDVRWFTWTDAIATADADLTAILTVLGQGTRAGSA